MAILESLSDPRELNELSLAELETLCGELRAFLIENVAKTGGHLSSNLGAVELTVALHRVYDTARDRLVFDVGHQCYVHKILTGRREAFSTLRQTGGLSGFPNPEESEHDAFVAGHASDSVSVALGMARARSLLGQDYHVAALIGDGALTGGLAYEALNDAGQSGEKLVIVLNDNGMAIGENVGGVARYLARERLKPRYVRFKRAYKNTMQTIPGGKSLYQFTHRVKTNLKNSLFHCSMFEEMGLDYVGPVDGHDLPQLLDALTLAKEMDRPVLVHVITKKGMGCAFTQTNPSDYHGVGRFDPLTGALPPAGKTFSQVFGQELLRLADREPRLCAVTAAMPESTGLRPFSRKYPQRFFDVGIAEEHAVSLCGGMAKQGMLPVFAVYSTFLQRSFDMLHQDVGMLGLHVVFGIDRAGIVGGDGRTHQGVFDVAMLSTVPGMEIWCPASFAELRDMLDWAVTVSDGPVAVRYPRGSEGLWQEGGAEPVRVLARGKDLTLLTYGLSLNESIAAVRLAAEAGLSVGLIKLGRIHPIDFDELFGALDRAKRVAVLEESADAGSVGQAVAAEAARRGVGMQVLRWNAGDGYLPGGAVADVRRNCGLDGESVARRILAACEDN